MIGDTWIPWSLLAALAEYYFKINPRLLTDCLQVASRLLPDCVQIANAHCLGSYAGVNFFQKLRLKKPHVIFSGADRWSVDTWLVCTGFFFSKKG